MKAYVMRHCLTDSGPEMDADRPLNDTGTEQAHVMRKFLKRAGVNLDLIVTSDFARALDTAKIMQRGDTPLVTTPLLRPDGDQSKAWKFIAKEVAKLGKDPDDSAPAVLIVTHAPLIYPLWAAVAIPAFVDENWQFHHGAIGYSNTHEARFRWYVNPKLAAHLVGEDPKEVENPLGESLRVNWNDVQPLFAQAQRLSENLMADARRSTIEPLRNQMRTAVSMRWTKQLKRVRRALRKHDVEDAHTTSAALATVIPFHDKFFALHHGRIKADAYRAGTHHVAAQLGIDVAGAVQGVEADAPKRKPVIPKPDPQRISDQGDDLEDSLDKTTVDRSHTALTALEPFTLAGALVAMNQLFQGFTDPGKGKLSRADTVALQTVSNGYHAGGKDTATAVVNSGAAVEKQWDIGAEGCAICEANADEGWIDNDDPHGSGDFEPPAHVNCDCSESYRMADE